MTPTTEQRTVNRVSEGSTAAVVAPSVAVVLINLEAESDTAACIESLYATGYARLRVVLVDNGSRDGSGERLHERFPKAEYLQTGANLGFTGGNNLGIGRALELGCDYVLVLNNDTVVEPGCLAALVAAAEAAAGVGAVGGKILYFDDPARIWFGGGDFDRKRALGLHRLEGQPDAAQGVKGTEEVTFLTGCCMLFPAGVLREAGAFEEDFFIYVEDAELSLRLRKMGYRLLYEPRARLLHRVPVQEPPVAPHKIVLRDRNRRRLVRRRYSKNEAMRFSAFFYPTRIVRLIQYIAAGDRERASAIWRGMTDR